MKHNLLLPLSYIKNFLYGWNVTCPTGSRDFNTWSLPGAVCKGCRTFWGWSLLEEVSPWSQAASGPDWWCNVVTCPPRHVFPTWTDCIFSPLGCSFPSIWLQQGESSQLISLPLTFDFQGESLRLKHMLSPWQCPPLQNSSAVSLCNSCIKSHREGFLSEGWSNCSLTEFVTRSQDLGHSSRNISNFPHIIYPFIHRQPAARKQQSCKAWVCLSRLLQVDKPS